MPIEYNSLVPEITQRTRLSDMPGRDKVNLCWHLLMDLGIIAELIADRELGEKFDVIWAKQVKKFWD